MREWKKQTRVTWHCLYHIAFIPKYRKKAIFGRLRQEIGQVFHELCTQFGIELVEGHAQPDHVHMCLSPMGAKKPYCRDGHRCGKVFYEHLKKEIIFAGWSQTDAVRLFISQSTMTSTVFCRSMFLR